MKIDVLFCGGRRRWSGVLKREVNGIHFDASRRVHRDDYVIRPCIALLCDRYQLRRVANLDNFTLRSHITAGNQTTHTMPPRTTRNTRAKAADEAPATTTTSTKKYILEAETDNPPRLFVLPKKVTDAARIITLPHPRHTSKPARFLVCPETGIYEFTDRKSVV